jgi:transcriptional regulator with XRE-family HTH domain
MVSHRLENYLRTYRKKSGLTQQEVAFLLGRKDGAQFSRYEKRYGLPSLRIALGYEAVFKVPVAELFAGVRDSVDREISGRIDKLNADLQEKRNQKRNRLLTATKLSWISECHDPKISS